MVIESVNPLIQRLYVAGTEKLPWHTWGRQLQAILQADVVQLAVVGVADGREVVSCCDADDDKARDNLNAFKAALVSERDCDRVEQRFGWFARQDTPYGLWLCLGSDAESALWQHPAMDLLRPHLVQWGSVLRASVKPEQFLLAADHTAALLCDNRGQLLASNPLGAELLQRQSEQSAPVLPSPLTSVMESHQSCWVPRMLWGRSYQVLVRPFFEPPGSHLMLIRVQGQSRAFSPQYFQKLYDLSKKEAAVAVLLANGLLAQQIAESLYIGESTVRSHIRKILQKTDSRSLNHLMVKMHCGLNGLEWSGLYPPLRPCTDTGEESDAKTV
ncbi:helix-turn-helix transcriptional regulator [Ferrimonas sp. SCSIO 43195]|uniref:helix-turn-helix transcriptional regulator n=1 Tax=Ferrimonas sp. SCSIO 43195 TaxID=2822844 RepID=UPI002075824C|nr:helix-turn-helix transcriptional regulator [Ferrimonas sp. SCSIO 43195]USD36699.1 helix-turn-helix transcriptional regulator [Ferrimonas sp. SCSIO 43195]